jgi:hypothetical protein
VGAHGLITSNFFVSDTSEVTDNHLGVIFVPEPDSSEAQQVKRAQEVER